MVEAVHPEEEVETEVVAVATAGDLPFVEAIVVAPPIVAAEAIVVALHFVAVLPHVGAVDLREAMHHSFSTRASLQISTQMPAHRTSSSRASAEHSPGPSGPHGLGMAPRGASSRCGPTFSRSNLLRTRSSSTW